MVHQRTLTETSQQKGRHGHLHFSELQGQRSKDISRQNWDSQEGPMSASQQNLAQEKHEEDSWEYPREETKSQPARVVECHLMKGTRVASDTKSNSMRRWRNYVRNELLNVSMNDRDQNQETTRLSWQTSKQFWQITTPGIRTGVCHSWQAENSTLPPSGSFQSKA